MDFVTFVAKALGARLKLNKEEAEAFLTRGKSATYWDMVRRYVEQFPAGVLGELVASGKAHGSESGVTLYQVHCGTYLDKYASGLENLVILATTAVIARMVELAQEYAEEPIASS